MLRYLWNRGQNPSSEREKLQKELFSFSKNVQYGFPHKPVDMDWDPHLKLLAIVTRNGFIRIFGQPGALSSSSYGWLFGGLPAGEFNCEVR